MSPPGVAPTAVMARGNESNERKRTADSMPNEDDVCMQYTPPYDPRTEVAFRSVTLSADWEAYQKGKSYIHELLTIPFKTSSHRDTFIDGLIEMIDQCILQTVTEEIVVYCTGAMANGQKLKPNQKTAFLGEVEFFDRQERREVLSNFFAAYYRATHHEGDSDEGVFVSSPTTAEGEEETNIRNDVADAFVAMFCDHAECGDAWAARQFLDSAKSEDDPEMLSTIYGWADKAIRKAAGQAQTVVLEASTGGELLKKLEPFSTKVEDDDGKGTLSLWPLVSVVHEHFDDPITRLNITMMDIPGSSDNNRTRQISALKHRQKATHVMIFTDVARAKDDPTIFREVKNMRNRGSGRLMIVSPKSDIIGDATIPNGTKREKEEIQRLKAKASQLEKEKNAVGLQIRSSSGEAQNLLFKKKAELEVRVQNAKNAEKAYRINMRGESNKAVLQDKLREVTRSRTLIPVLSISNTEYAKHLEGYAPEDAPLLSVEETNIPAARRIVKAFPNEARLNEAKFLQTDLIPRMLSRVKLYTSTTAVNRKTDIEKYIEKPQGQYAVIIGQNFNAFGLRIQELITGPLRAHEADWALKAAALCDGWCANLRTEVFLAVMKRDGKRNKSSKNPEINLNADLVNLKSDLTWGLFQRLLQSQTQLQMDLDEEISKLITTMTADMNADENAPFVALSDFFNYVQAEMNRITHAVQTWADRLFEGITLVSQRLRSEDQDAYLSAAMLPIYERVRDLKGGPGKGRKPKGGWPAYRKVAFKQEVSKLMTDLGTALRTEQANLTAAIGAVFKDFRTGYNMLCKAKDSNDPKEKKLREVLIGNVKKAEEQLMGPMQQALDRMLKDFR
ncbi:hypothetical protein LTR85_006634 [Meristemomyces frigidus]|nr:hypothetical protein LTR85_006634 [Meristemomyces frigidus]